MKTLVRLIPLVAFSTLLSLAQADSAPAVPADYAGKPYSGAPQAIPGTIQAESYDLAPGDAKDISFGYNGKLAKTPFRTSADGLGIAGFGKGHMTTTGQAEAPDQVYLGWTQTGEWLKYTVKVTDAGTYVVGGKFAAGGKGAKVSFSFSPGITTGPIEIPTTAGFQPGVEVYHVWEKLDHLAEVTLPAGIYVMTFKIESNAGLNLDYFTLTKKP